MKNKDQQSLKQFDQFLNEHFSTKKSIDVPDDLDFVVRNALEMGHEALKVNQRHLFMKTMAKLSLSLATFVLVFLNISPTFAKAMGEIPIAGQIFDFFTFREYHYEDEIQYIHAIIPEFQNTGKSHLEARVNREIQYFVNKELESSKEEVKAYYDASLATGGKKEDFQPVGITIDYKVYYMNPDIVSFSISRYETAFSAYNKKTFYNIDMESGSFMTLKDYLGNDYKERCIEAIQQEISTWTKEEKDLLWNGLNFEDLINENLKYYIDENRNAVIVFEKYQVAVGAVGEVTFTIPVKGIQEDLK